MRKHVLLVRWNAKSIRISIIVKNVQPHAVNAQQNAKKYKEKNMKNYIRSLTIVSMVLLSGSCAPAYVSSEPTYVEVVRPQQPSAVHIWIGGGWTYNRHTRNYVQRNGYWAKPKRGRSYHEGYWRKSRRGSVWVNGHW